MQPIRITLAPRAASATLLAASQAGPETGAALTLTATAAGPIDPQASLNGIVGQIGLGRIVSITSAGVDTGITFAVVGIDQNGNAASETVTGASGAAAVTTKYYTSITSITPSGDTASTVEAGIVGTTASCASAIIPLNHYARIGATVQVDVSGTISYTVQMTFDGVQGNAAVSKVTSFATPASPTALTAQSAAKYTQLPPGVTGINVTIPTYSTNGTITVNVIEPSNSSAG